FTRSAFFAISSGGSSEKKFTPSTMASVVTTRSDPAGGVAIAASSVRPNAAADVASGANSCAIRANSPGRSSSEPEFVIRPCFSKFRGTLAARHPIKQRVHEGRLVGTEERVRNVEIFVDHNLRRHILSRDQFVYARSQD